ncbi:PTS sugar transporter subunit IIB [Erysipelothrix rhusiopathiae]|uniref:PTS sugar transporter subunit IIB n=1 Tax=Erysipelothrix rhusiopathiae TaxID=1648 RepID=UPI001EDE7752|nr:PTS sugar transporter subunit IIB [Erysipelothrix rhusiopathiae]MCG4457511.1 PTS sugar transporter subunit IIB [Erysipelothrix rhusiopathiae]MDE8054004.1 PTS sugar transporter subunit IIB [Erysipelothrix rhusiopathiae]MDE8055258.1 PTS sugar transporter subunit IIB [Erysipelothrix rhusiopathiae]MDE8092132.1 PTS sugar transporter subunit IIB [Erysipelothrix rhusiopathiae]MDE8098119.1 PTS sugar transporter subunit IIB [Erysipelothrix rhusiopathiae]
MAKIIVACGSGVATSQTVASKVERLLEERGIKTTVEAVDIKSLSTFIKDADVYIAITKPKETFDIPVINGIAFLTGMGQEEELDKIIKAIQK